MVKETTIYKVSVSLSKNGMNFFTKEMNVYEHPKSYTLRGDEFLGKTINKSKIGKVDTNLLNTIKGNDPFISYFTIIDDSNKIESTKNMLKKIMVIRIKELKEGLESLTQHIQLNG